MEEKVNVWKANLTNGLILASAGILFLLILYFFDLFFSKSAGLLKIPIQLGLLYFLLKSYRDNFMHGQITYGQSVGAGVVMYVYVAVLTAIYMYILYAIIDPGLAKKSLAITEEAMVNKGAPQAAIDTAISFSAKLMKPAIIAILSIFTTLFGGVIYSLLVSIFIKKEGNPLIDTPIN